MNWPGSQTNSNWFQPQSQQQSAMNWNMNDQNYQFNMFKETVYRSLVGIYNKQKDYNFDFAFGSLANEMNNILSEMK